MKMLITVTSPCAMLFFKYLVVLHCAFIMHGATVLSESAFINVTTKDNSSAEYDWRGSSFLEKADPKPFSNMSVLLPRFDKSLDVDNQGSTEGNGAVKDNAVVNLEAEKANNSKTPVWYSTAGWMPQKGIRTDRSVNLTVLPMLALLFFVFGVCIKCYSWMREQDRTKARGQLDFEDGDEINYSIITAGEQGYREVDLRSDCTSMYDTINSFHSLRLPINDHTVTSIKSLPNQPYETYRNIILQKANDGGVYDSVHSYKAFLEMAMETTEVDIEVELVDNYSPRPRSKSFGAGETKSPAAQKSRKRRIRHHSGGRGLEGSVRSQAEKERCRRHSEKSAPHQPHPESFQSKTFHRRSSPAILEPLFQGEELPTPLEQTDEDEEQHQHVTSQPVNLSTPDRRRSSDSSSTSSFSSSNSHKGREPFRKHRKKPASKDRSAEKLAKGSSHSSGHCSDNSPRSSSSSKGSSSSSNELDSESDVTDSGLVVDLPKPVEKSCFKKAGDGARGDQSPCDLKDDTKSSAGKVHRFKVSFVDDTTLPASSD